MENRRRYSPARDLYDPTFTDEARLVQRMLSIAVTTENSYTIYSG